MPINPTTLSRRGFLLGLAAVVAAAVVPAEAEARGSRGGYRVRRAYAPRRA